MLGYLLVAALILGVFVYEGVSFWWRQNAWKRRWKDQKDDE